MADIDSEIAAYEAMREQLEAEHTGRWVLFHDRQLIGLYDTFEAAAEDATRRFGGGPYLIRQVGAQPATGYQMKEMWLRSNNTDANPEMAPRMAPIEFARMV